MDKRKAEELILRYKKLILGALRDGRPDMGMIDPDTIAAQGAALISVLCSYAILSNVPVFAIKEMIDELYNGIKELNGN